MKLVDDWKRVLKRSWSVRFNIIAAVCQGLLWGTSGLWVGLEPRVIAAFVVACVALNVAPIAARVIWQPNMRPEDVTDAA